MRFRIAAVVVALIAVLSGSAEAAEVAVPSGVTRDVAYKRVGNQELQLDLYVPGGTAPRPAVILVHGGGWRRGDRRDLTGIANQFMRLGFVAVSIDYRLDVPVGHPAEVEDVQSAISWLSSRAALYGIDRNKITLLGTSAGGNLAALAATRPARGGTTPPAVRAVVSWSGPMEFFSLHAQPDRYVRSTIEGYLSCVPSECFARAYDASPLFHVNELSPPMLLANSDREQIPSAQAVLMAWMLRTRGVRAELVIVPGNAHGRGLAGAVMDDSVAFLESVVGSPPPAPGR